MNIEFFNANHFIFLDPGQESGFLWRSERGGCCKVTLLCRSSHKGSNNMSVNGVQNQMIWESDIIYMFYNQIHNIYEKMISTVLHCTVVDCLISSFDEENIAYFLK